MDRQVRSAAGARGPAGARGGIAAAVASRPPSAWVFAMVALVASVAVAVVLARSVDADALARAVRAVASSPLVTAGVLGAFGAAFVLRAAVWRRLLPALPFGHALAAIHLALGGNHVLPFRLGEPLRVLSVVRRAGVPADVAAASTLTLRAADLLALVALGSLAAPPVVARLAGSATVVVLVALAGGAVVGAVWVARLARRRREIERLDLLAVAGTAAAWLLEALVVWQSARWAGIDLGFSGAIAVTAGSVVAQSAAVTPGGVGTYEAGATAAYVALGHAAGPGLAAALTAHAVKTLYSVVAGAVALGWPAPGLLGRLRLDPAGAPRSAAGAPPEGPVVLFLPAHDEEATVAGVVARAPRTVSGRPVEVVVVDDGSSDDTARAAVAAGARLVTHRENLGLGAAVRTGLADAVERGAAAVAFCDADGEYAPGELERLVAPVLSGEADYVVGSRFAGGPRRMRPHRRLGNVVLTRLTGFVARRPLSDGQSGYRALSRGAAASAEIVHDFNYAQVLTLDLLAKGFRYREVPISYGFRRHGRSFVRLLPYLRRVVPAVHREVNDHRAVDGASRPSPAAAEATPPAESLPERTLSATGPEGR